jgi:hypothetical protein
MGLQTLWGLLDRLRASTEISSKEECVLTFLDKTYKSIWNMGRMSCLLPEYKSGIKKCNSTQHSLK